MGLFDSLFGASPAAAATPPAPLPDDASPFQRLMTSAGMGSDLSGRLDTTLGALGAGLLTGTHFNPIGPGFSRYMEQSGRDADVQRQRAGLRAALRMANPSLTDAQLDALSSDPGTAKIGLGAIEAQASAKAGQQASGVLSGLLSGGSGAEASTGGLSLTGDMGQFAQAIQKKESGGNYNALGPKTASGDRAHGAYQVMGTNVGPWTEEVLGRRMTPEEFRADKGAQDAVFAAKFGQSVAKYGNPQDAASVWFTGRPLAQGAGAKDVLGTSGAGYVAAFNQALQGAQPQRAPAPGGARPVQVADASGAVPVPTAPSLAPPPSLAPAAPLRPAPVQVAESEDQVRAMERRMGMLAPGGRAAPTSTAEADMPAPGAQNADFVLPPGPGGRTYGPDTKTGRALAARAANAGPSSPPAPSFALNDPAQATRAIPRLYQVLAIPNLPDAQRVQAKAMLDHALGVVRPTDRARGLMEAGYEPNTPAYREAYRNLLNGDRTPMGYRLAGDGQSLEAIPGGPADQANRASVKAPTGFRVGADGQTFEYVPGGPADPATISAGAQARAAGRPAPAPKPLPHNAVKDLSEAGGSYGDFNRLVGGFRPEYGGWKSAPVGDAANSLARYTGIGNTEAADWWADYSAKRNVTRNKLFGSALTTQEKSEFEKADITPGMTPQAIQKNLARQQAAATAAARKMAGYYVKSGRNPEEIEAALGVGLDEIGFGEGGGAGQPTAPAPREAPTSGGLGRAGAAPQGAGFAPPSGAVDMLRANPGLREQFDAKYGSGAAARALGGR